MEIYCRLCARLAGNGAFNLSLESPQRTAITSKLARLNSVDLTTRDNLPKTVCLLCHDMLDKTHEFVVNIEKAQTLLQEMFSVSEVKEEKREVIYSDDCSDAVHQDDNDDDDELDDKKPLLQLKLEENQNSDDECLTKAKRRRKSRRKKKKLRIVEKDLDSLFDEKEIKYDVDEVWKDYPWKCRVCYNQFGDVQQLRLHSLETHDICCVFKCIDCDKHLSSFDNFISHVKRHRKHLKYCCHFCDQKFDSSANVKLHLCEHELSNRCQLCGGCFNNEQTLQEHREKYLAARKRKNSKIDLLKKEDLTCNQCDKVFKSRANLQVHQLIHTERRRDHTCDKCGKTFFNKGTLGSHMILHEDSRPFKCEICGATFKTTTQLRSHVGIHGGPRPYSCEQCGRSFRLRCHLKSHLIIHTDSMPHTCEFCGKAFRFKTILTQHLRQHTGVKPYVCQLCQRDFTNWPNYNKHMKRRHGIDTAKKKHTPEGVFPINPLTGEVQILPNCPSEAGEWRDRIMNHVRKPGRPKMNLTEMNKAQSLSQVSVDAPTQVIDMPMPLPDVPKLENQDSPH